MPRSKSNAGSPYFRYTPLAKRSIRLLKIHNPVLTNPPHHPSEPQKRICVSLETHELSSCPPYVALSYSWGEPTHIADATSQIFTTVARCYPIFCEDHLLRGTRNLRDALRRLRINQQETKIGPALSSKSTSESWADLSGGKPVLYWIDALCINQDDDDERSAQVALMGSVYKLSTVCLVWLGEGDGFTDNALRFAVKVWDGTCEALGPGVLPELPEQLDISEDESRAVAALFTRTWFTRLWIVQEVVLAPVVWAQCGTSFLDFKCILRLARSLVFNRAFMEAQAAKDEGRFSWDPLDMEPNLYNHVPLFLSQLEWFRDACAAGLKNEFHEVVRMVGRNKVSDARDNVYGILDITSEFDTKPGEARIITPDYKLSVAQVYVDAVAALSRRRNDLSFLALVGKRIQSTIPDLPTWCPDLSRGEPGLMNEGVHKPVKPLLPFWNTRKAPYIRFQDKLLVVDGVRHDVVARIPRREREQPVVNCISVLLELIYDRGPGVAGSVAGSLEALWRITLIDSLGPDSPPPPVVAYIFPAICIWWIWINAKGPENGREKKHVEEHVAVAKAETETFIGIARKFRQSDPRCDLILPSEVALSSFRDALGNISSPARVGDLASVCNLFIQQELQSVPGRAQKAGAEQELKRLLGLHSTSPQIPWERLRRFMHERLLPPVIISQSRFMFLFLTKSEHLGIILHPVLPGDEVWLLHGCDYSVILRPTESGQYIFCGMAHIQGDLRAGNLERDGSIMGQVKIKRISLK